MWAIAGKTRGEFGARVCFVLHVAALAWVVTALAGCAPKALDDGTPVIWPDQGEYKTKVAKFAVTPEQAYEKAVAAARAEVYRNFDPAVLVKHPLLIVGEEYLIGTPAQRGVWLTGWYVHGETGNVRYRKVDRMLYRGMVGELLHP